MIIEYFAGAITVSALVLAMRNRSKMLEARGYAERLVVIAIERRNTIDTLKRDISFITSERDTAWAKLARRSAGVARGNRTRAAKRRLIPPAMNDHRQLSWTSEDKLSG